MKRSGSPRSSTSTGGCGQREGGRQAQAAAELEAVADGEIHTHRPTIKMCAPSRRTCRVTPNRRDWRDCEQSRAESEPIVVATDVRSTIWRQLKKALGILRTPSTPGQRTGRPPTVDWALGEADAWAGHGRRGGCRPRRTAAARLPIRPRMPPRCVATAGRGLVPRVHLG